MTYPQPNKKRSGLGLSGRPLPIARLYLMLAAAFCLELIPFPTLANGPSLWERSIVNVEVARKQYDYTQPWTRRTKRVQKTGTVIAERQILTTADELFERTLVRLQKYGRGRWFAGEVQWIDYHANLALLTVAEPDFWRDLTPATLGSGVPDDGSLQILRWRDGNLESRRAEFTRVTVREGQLSQINLVAMEATSEISAAGQGEPVIAGNKLAAIVASQESRTCVMTPVTFIRSIMEARDKGAYHGLGFFHFYWQPAANPTSLAYLKQTGAPRGVIIVSVPPRPDGGEQVLKPQDIILTIDGFGLDIQGDYADPEYGHLILESLATRRKWAGDEIKMQILREGKQLDVLYRLPKYEYENALVPWATFDKEPEYLLVGGLVFQPLTDSFLQSWGPEWKRRSPFRLYYYNEDTRTEERKALVLLSEVLPDPYNIGYQQYKYLVLDRVNGQSINYLADLRDALEHPSEGYHVLEFVQSDSLRRIVLEAGDTEKDATSRVLKRYGIAEQLHLEKKKS